MKRAGFTTGYYAVRVQSGIGWAFYKENRLARMRAAFEGHGYVTWMSEAVANRFIDKGGQVA